MSDKEIPVPENPEITRQRKRIADLESELAMSKNYADEMFTYMTEVGDRLAREHGIYIDSEPGRSRDEKAYYKVRFLCAKKFQSRVDATLYAEALAKLVEGV